MSELGSKLIISSPINTGVKLAIYAILQVLGPDAKRRKNRTKRSDPILIFYPTIVRNIIKINYETRLNNLPSALILFIGNGDVNE